MVNGTDAIEKGPGFTPRPQWSILWHMLTCIACTSCDRGVFDGCHGPGYRSHKELFQIQLLKVPKNSHCFEMCK